MLKKLLPVFGFFLFFIFCGTAGAEEVTLRPPRMAVISLGSATLYFEDAIVPKDGEVSIVIPQNARNLEIGLKNANMRGRRSEPCMIRDDSFYGRYIERMDRERMNLSARLNAINAELDIWKAKPGPDTGLSEFQWRIEHMAPAMEKLLTEKAEIDRKMRAIDVSDRAPDQRGQRIVIVTDRQEEKSSIPRVRDDKPVIVNYSYTLPSCGWRPSYSFTARKNGVEAKLQARIRQFSQMDWKGTDIIVSMGNTGRVSPRPLPVWRIELPRKENNKAVVMADNAVVSFAAAGSAVKQDAPEARTDGVFARWMLPEKEMLQGETVVDLASDTWNASLERLSRPGLSGFSPVFLVATHELPKDSVWPSGPASYNVEDADGNVRNVGMGQFFAESRRVSLDFGIDPRVTVKTVTDTKEQGKDGIIVARNTWRWKNIYVVENHHAMPIRVKVERPLPESGNRLIEVKRHSEPKAEKDERAKALYWVLEVPANGEKEIVSETEVSVKDNDATVGFEPVMPN